MKKFEIHFGEVETAISVMREVAASGRDKVARAWSDEWFRWKKPGNTNR